MKKILSITLILLLTLSLSTFALARGGERIIATKNQLETSYKNQYQLSSGDFVDVKITQEQAKEQIRLRIQEKLRIPNCSCENMQVVEIQDKNKGLRIAYQVNEEKEGRLFGLFKAKVNIETNLDIETGEIISMKKPWYMWMMSFKR